MIVDVRHAVERFVGAYRPASQATHVALLTAPVAAEERPALQALQEVVLAAAA